MRTDILDLHDFYLSPLGVQAKGFVSARIEEAWREHARLRIAGFGHAEPYLSLFPNAERTLAIAPGAQGVIHWPADGKNAATLAGEGFRIVSGGTDNHLMLVDVTPMKLTGKDAENLLQEARGYQLVSYEDFRGGEEESFVDRYCTDGRPDPLGFLMERAVREELVAAIDELPDREKKVMGLYYEQELNLREIGEVLGVSESRICQLHTQAIARLRARLRHSA